VANVLNVRILLFTSQVFWQTVIDSNACPSFEGRNFGIFHRIHVGVKMTNTDNDIILEVLLSVLSNSLDPYFVMNPIVSYQEKIWTIDKNKKHPTDIIRQHGSVLKVADFNSIQLRRSNLPCKVLQMTNDPLHFNISKNSMKLAMITIPKSVWCCDDKIFGMVDFTDACMATFQVQYSFVILV
jgi:hypothetical protein